MTEEVQLFITCLIDTFFPEVGEAVLDLLEASGIRVAFPARQTCCGQPAFNAGFQGEAKSMARHTITVFEKTTGAIVVPSGSCASMIRNHYPELFADDPHWLPRAENLAHRIYEFSQYLVDVLGIEAAESPYQGKIAYHPSCHLLRGLGVDRQPMTLLSSLPNVELHKLEPDCCGFGGIFAVEQAEISTEMMKRKIEQIERCNADVVVAADVSCLMQIEGGLRRRGSQVRCAHLAQILADHKGTLK